MRAAANGISNLTKIHPIDPSNTARFDAHRPARASRTTTHHHTDVIIRHARARTANATHADAQSNRRRGVRDARAAADDSHPHRGARVAFAPSARRCGQTSSYLDYACARARVRRAWRRVRKMNAIRVIRLVKGLGTRRDTATTTNTNYYYYCPRARLERERRAK